MLEEMTRETVRIPGPRGLLAGELAYGSGAITSAFLLINPHPHMGGRMSNSLILHLAETLTAAGAATLRFDYAGVGESEGPDLDVYASMAQFWETGAAPEDPAMIEDARQAARWLTRQVKAPLVYIGYSFGTYAAAMILDSQAAGIALISPTVGRHDFSRLQRSPHPKLVVYSDDDFATPPAATRQWIASLPNVRSTHCIPGGNHFFRGQELQVAGLCRAFVAGLIRGEG
jgi:alpha/beta superfamily hydrolase